MEKIKARELLINYRAQLTGADIVLDDGRDEGDAVQNRAFAAAGRKMDAIIQRIASVDVDGIDCDAVWLDAWTCADGSRMRGTHLPEAKYAHAVNYVDALLSMLQ